MMKKNELKNINGFVLNDEDLSNVNGGWVVRDKSINAWMAVSEDGTEIYGTFYDEPDEEGEVNCVAICKADACAHSHGATANAFYGSIDELRTCIATNNWKGHKMCIVEAGGDPLQWMSDHNLL